MRPIRYSLLAIGLGLAGCATPQAPVAVVANNFCMTAKKYSWSTEDSQITIAQIVKHNSGIDRACGIPKTS
jgi:hypothetical protein